MRSKLESLKAHRTSVIVAFLFAMTIFIIAPIMPLIDSAGYMDTAKSLYLGRGFICNFEPDTTSSPGLPYMAAFFMFVFGLESVLYMKMFASVFAFLLFISIYFLTYEISGNKYVSILSSLLSAAVPELVFTSLQMLSDIPFLAFILFSAVFYARFIKKVKISDATLCGVFMGFAILTRSIGVIFLGILLFHLSFSHIQSRKNIKQFFLKRIDGNLLKSASTILAAVFLVMLPWSIFAFSQGFNPILVHVYGGVMSARYSRVIDISRFFGGDFLVPFLGEKITIPPQFVNLLKMSGSALLYIGPVALIIVFYFLYKTVKNRNKLPLTGLREKCPQPCSFSSLLIMWLLIYFLFHLFSPADFSARYILIFIPPVMIKFSEWVSDNWAKRKNFIVIALAIQLVFSLTVMAYDSGSRWANTNTMVHYYAGKWIKANTTENVLHEIGSGSGVLMSYYADRKTISLGNPVEDYRMQEIRNIRPPTLLITNVMHRTFDEKKLISILEYELCAEFSDARFFARIYRKKC